MTSRPASGGSAARVMGCGLSRCRWCFCPRWSCRCLKCLGARSRSSSFRRRRGRWRWGGALLLTGLVTHSTRQLSDWRDPLLLVLVLGAWLLHPLAYFIAYWCFLHSPRHLEVASRDLGLESWGEKLRAVAPTTLATYALAIAAIPFLIGLPADAVLLRVIFVGLAALTVPHMVVEFIAEARGAGQSPHPA